MNLVSNAVKFTEEGSITVEASLVTSPTGHPEVMITVTDSGDGIAEEDRDKLFQPFSQVDDSHPQDWRNRVGLVNLPEPD